ncbi:branched chain amino acid ABC transporter substrate-binding protein [Streptomyces spiroverticillatus]|uniref:Branched chain amino acid ABC transporter substrate-binding protein n=1 Tax=Streptomyces finlayi TaxID=67296 RepID=A0A919C9D4_9ACTN|nr:branched-chain amino acid ABC transporter substrate-binding protein [Streptomyces finlayi]GHA02179.1 branched chain amino acid ABC transporter substrate-binding protein [Streptomyces spiroverticillatus]GHC86419.1 branched chain amino acid ABC transporter substrate-binding protein [Streptomyces finlayi]
MRRSTVALPALAVCSALLVSACGTRSEAGATPGGAAAGETTVVIGFDGPLTGDLSALAIGAKNAAQLAVDQANKNKSVPGVKFALKSLDDQGQPGTGQQNATALTGDKQVLGVVGPLNSGVAKSMQMIFETAKLAVVSPATTSPGLTQGDNWAKGTKERRFTTYFRTATTDAVQGPFAAQHMHDTLKLTKVFVVDDKKAYGAGLAATFTDEFKKRGGQVVDTDQINSGEKDFSSVINKIKSSGAQFVYYGGEYPDAGPLTGQLKKAGVKIPLVGGDGIADANFVKLAGGGATGDYCTTVGAPLEEGAAGKTFAAAYKAAAFKDPYGAYGGYAYDSATTLVEAVKAVVAANGGKVPADARAKVTEAVQKVAFDGVTGKVSFDEFGDTTNKQLTVNQVKDGAWAPVTSGTFTAK